MARGDPLGRDGLFQQRLEAEFFEQGGDGQQAAVGSQLLAAEVIGRGSPDFIGPRGPRSAALFDGPWGAMLSSIGNHLGDLLGVGWRSWNLCQPTFYPMFSGVPQWSLAAQPSSAAPAVHNSGNTVRQINPIRTEGAGSPVEHANPTTLVGFGHILLLSLLKTPYLGILRMTQVLSSPGIKEYSVLEIARHSV